MTAFVLFSSGSSLSADPCQLKPVTPHRLDIDICSGGGQFFLKPAVCFIKNFVLKRGALASSVAHDSHNIVAVGVTDSDILHAVNLLIEHGGGVTAYCGTEMVAVPLPVAGLMSNGDGYAVAATYQNADALAKRLGSTLYAPFMTLAFMALLVIPELKLSDQGLFDVTQFGFTPLYNEA